MPSLAPAAPERIGGRFRVDGLLSRGGMGAVFRVYDESAARLVALKRLHAGDDAAATRMFEREFQTLAELRHPRIIEVYEYGVDASGPYYTMELLEGAELRDLAPLSCRAACRHVRDVASSLRLLHARQLMHRDVSPRNVKLSRDGYAKLIDFGALATFGLTEQVVGTPPCIAPEVLLGVPLDQRADLYSLGAVLYFALTGRHAYPVVELDELLAAWRVPPPKPSAFSAEVPPRLDDLVMSLLSYDPLARPASASEVIQRLEAIADLEAEDGPEQSRSFLVSSPLVGRDPEVTHVRARLQEAVAGAGGTLIVDGAAGVGKSRLLATAMIEGHLAGMLVARAAAREHAGAYGVVRALFAAALHGAPDVTAQAIAPRLALLVHAVPELRDRFAVASGGALPDDPVERRLQIQEAVVRALADVAARQPLLVVVDDLQRADSGSVEALAGLAREAPSRALFLVGTLRSGEEPSAPAALAWLRKAAVSIELGPLPAGHTEALVRAYFGDAPHAGRLAAWMHGLTGGNPSQIVDVALHLLRKGIVRYTKGVWTLPSDTAAGDLPSSVEQARRHRVAALSATARSVAEQLSVHRGPLHVDLCKAISGERSLRPFDELVARGVLARVGDRYAFADEALRETLWRDLDAARRRDLHLRLGEALVAREARAPTVDGALDAGWHFLHGGETQRGAVLLQDAATELAWAGDGLQAAAAPLEAALAAYAARGRPPEDCPDVVIPLVVGGQAFDRRLVARHGRAAFVAARRASGLDVAERLGPFLGERAALYTGFAVATTRFALRPKRERREGFPAMIMGSMSAGLALVASATSQYDPPEVRRLLAGLAPLRALPIGHVGRFIHDVADGLLQIVLGRDAPARRAFRDLLAELDRPTSLRDLPGSARGQFRAGMLLAMGVGDAYLGGALERAEAIEALGLRSYQPAAEQLRALHHAHRGRVDLAEQHAGNADALAAGRMTPQLEAVMPQTFSTIHRLTGDVVGLRRSVEQLTTLADELPSLAFYRDLARAGWHASLGDLDSSARLYASTLGPGVTPELPGWLPALGLHAGVLNALGRHEAARDLCERIFAIVPAEDLGEYIFHLVPERERALADAGLGHAAAAAARLEALIETAERGRNPLECGLLRRDRAELALAAGDRGGFDHHFEMMNAWFRSTRNPALVAQCERLGSRAVSRPRAVSVVRETTEATVPRARARGSR